MMSKLLVALCLVVYANANTVTKFCTVPFDLNVAKTPCKGGANVQKLSYAAGQCTTSNDNFLAIKPNADCTAFTLYKASGSQTCDGTVVQASTPGPVCVDCNGGTTSCAYFGAISAAPPPPPFGPPPPPPGPGGNPAPGSGAMTVAPLFALLGACLALFL
eukprot:TRINITY_DN104744_c0_g1_i1.p1 TRINITY_DN104744_c0_g1~~TRINITY_DN104744_c0_g1_i1.p1  ORF type:complete len:160 (+),score=32.76 TRINITY_DN104744_c0_g1_i1:38-517(+)